MILKKETRCDCRLKKLNLQLGSRAGLLVGIPNQAANALQNEDRRA